MPDLWVKGYKYMRACLVEDGHEAFALADFINHLGKPKKTIKEFTKKDFQKKQQYNAIVTFGPRNYRNWFVEEVLCWDITQQRCHKVADQFDFEKFDK